MKKPLRNTALLLCFISFFLSTKLRSQASFTLAPSLCEGAVASVSVNTGTMSAMAYSWASIPSGPAFSSSSSATTTISFATAGTYTIGVGILTGTGFSYTTNVIVINPAPTVTVSPLTFTLCTGNSTTLSASGTGTAYSWFGNNLIGSTGTLVIASPTATSVYTVIASLGSCTASATSTISVVSATSLAVNSTTSSVCPGFTSTLTAFGASSYTWTSTSFTSSIMQQSVAVGVGTYSVVGFTNGCLSSTFMTVSQLPPLNIGVTASPANLTTCITSNTPKFSKPVTLSPVGAGSYTWFPYNPNQQSGPQYVVRPLASTCYTVMGSTAICSGSAVVCINVLPQFSAAVTPSAPVLCAGDDLPLAIVNIGASATGPASAFTYSWTEALNAPPMSLSDYFTPTVSIHPQNATTYTAEVRDAADCISTPVLVDVSMTLCTGLAKTSLKESNFKLYPNPAKDKMFIQSAVNSNSTVEILDAMGKILIKENRNFYGEEMIQSFNVSSLPAGIYFIRLNPDSAPTKILRLIKQ